MHPPLDEEKAVERAKRHFRVTLAIGPLHWVDDVFAVDEGEALAEHVSRHAGQLTIGKHYDLSAEEIR